jgi:tRNA A-37 threonylcarbamoyl transferase component Bud32
MEKKEEIIPYRSVPKWLLPAAGGLTVTGIASVVFFPASVAVIVCAGTVLPHATLIVLETFIRAVALLLLSIFFFLTFEISRNERVVFGDKHVTFPLFLAPNLLFRRKRSIDDICNVLLGAMLLEDKKGTYEYELERAKDKKRLFIYFKSGGHVALDLNKMPRESVELLFKKMEDFCIECSRAPKPDENRKSKKAKAKPSGEQKPPTYTQMWEDDMNAHFSATNFVPLEKGSTLCGGKFSVLMQLSSGGLSAVYLAETKSKELIVLKEAALPLSLPEQTRAKAKELFQRESTILRELNHTKIAKVLDYFVERGRDYLVIEFVAGENLRQLVKKRGTQSERLVLNVALQAAQILSYLHHRQPPVVHRDVTPDNMMLKENQDLVLIDFGAANQYVGTATGTLIGKQAYIAPEQFRGKATIQSDYYALGCTLYFLLTGHDPEALSMSHPKESRPDISDELDQLVADLTAMILDNRIKTAEELIDRVEKLIPDTVLSFSTAESR